MRGIRRAFGLLLAALMLASLVPERAAAAETVYFTAVNESVLDLNDETMPFWSGGVLYVAHAAFDRDAHELGVYYNRSRDKQSAMLFKQNSTLIFDLAAGAIVDRNGQAYSGSAIVRGDVVFLPLDVLCRFFGLSYSYTRISYGYLVRIRSDTTTGLSDATFIDAATSAMAQRYARYEKAHTSAPEDPEPQPDNSAVTPPDDSAVKPDNNSTQPEVRRTAYLVVESTDPARSEQALGNLASEDAAFLFSPEALAGADDLLRRLTASGFAVALRVDASDGAEAALARIEEANRALWTAANAKTRLVYLDGAEEETASAVAGAGYCPLRFAMDCSDELLSSSRAASRILSAADANGGSCRVFLGTDEAVSASLGALLSNLRAGNCTFARLNEVVA